jgi:ribosomal protein S7
MKKRLSKFQHNFYHKVLGCLIKKGKKAKVKRILDNSFSELIHLFPFPFSCFFWQIFDILNVFIESKKVRLRKRTHQIPFPIRDKRRSYLIIKWFVEAIKNNNNNKNLRFKIIFEVVSIMLSKNQKTKDKNLAP